MLKAFSGWRKGDPVKVAIAQRLRRETTMTLAYIAERLRMVTPVASIASGIASGNQHGMAYRYQEHTQDPRHNG